MLQDETKFIWATFKDEVWRFCIEIQKATTYRNMAETAVKNVIVKSLSIYLFRTTVLHLYCFISRWSSPIKSVVHIVLISF